jgi:hypothetical protein
MSPKLDILKSLTKLFKIRPDKDADSMIEVKGSIQHQTIKLRSIKMVH